MPTKSIELEYDKLERLLELAEMIGQQRDFDEILRVVTQQAASLLNAETALIMMINPQTHQTVKTVFKEGRETQPHRYHTVHAQVCGWVLKNNRAFLSLNIKDDPRFRKDRFKDLSLKSVMCVPLRTEGVVIGSILLLNKDHDDEFDENDLGYLQKLAAVAAPFLRNVQKIQEYFAAPLPAAALLAKYEPLGLLGKSKKFIELLQAVEAAALCDVRVLLEGQSGTGKELIARAIHQISARRDGPFVAIDCGAIPANLLESELFGHVKGAFTGAASDRKGLLEEAHQGTLFMDEIANLPLEMQTKLLRVLQDGEMRPLGSNKPRKIDVRIISASSAELRQLVDSRQFREDMYYRLHVYPIAVPALSERREDIPLLANHFLKKFAPQQQKPVEAFHEQVLDFMQQRQWEGNIRELENFVERLVTLAKPNITILRYDLLPPEYQKEFKKNKATSLAQTIRKSLNESLAEHEEQLIRQALIENDWNQSQAARVLKISEPNLRYRMNKLGITKPA
ncbi:sigma-54-dependent Fis family transcriptional regulator [candidate division KSB1 bacterium]|nr:sigma-54-dependent Fis family transcriptional regulator [candidate division KSB1 bacterium]